MLGTEDTRSPALAEKIRDRRSASTSSMTPISISITFMPLDIAESAALFQAGRKRSQK